MPDHPPPAPPAQEGSSLGPLRHWAFAVLWTATVVANIGTWMQNAAASWLMTPMTRVAGALALVQVATPLPMFVFALPAGALSDIVDRRRLLLVIQIAVTLWVAGFALLVWSGRVTPAILLGFTFIAATFASKVLFGCPCAPHEKQASDGYSSQRRHSFRANAFGFSIRLMSILKSISPARIRTRNGWHPRRWNLTPRRLLSR